MDSLPSAAEIKSSLLARMEAYRDATGTGATVLSLALADHALFHTRIAAGSDLQIDTLEKVARRLAVLEAAPEKLVYATARERMAVLEVEWAQRNHEGDSDGETEGKQNPAGAKRHRSESRAVHPAD